jgi:hypothetical protein
MRRRLWALAFWGIALAAMVVLSAGLTRLELAPGQPYSLGGRPEVRPDVSALPPASQFPAILQVLLVLALLLVVISIIYVIISPRARKQVLRTVAFALVFLFFVQLMRERLSTLNWEAAPTVSEGPLSPGSFPTLPTAEFVAAPPAWLILATSLALALLIASVVAGVVWWVWLRRRRAANPLEQLAQEAQEALDALQAGGDLKDVVLRCYLEMNRVLREQRGITRPGASTPREFEQQLERAGLPGEHVHRLTRLFEDVRYGAKVSGEREERQAIACLTAIVEHCRGLS